MPGHVFVMGQYNTLFCEDAFHSRMSVNVYNNIKYIDKPNALLYDGPDLKLFILVGWVRSFLSVAWPTGAQLVISIVGRGQHSESVSPCF